MTKEIYKQWELPPNSKVKIDNKIITFRKMDGMYAQWIDEKGKIKIGNFKQFIKKNNYFIIK